jgi:RNA polymerase sigma-70 factor, ECF subfamily
MAGAVTADFAMVDTAVTLARSEEDLLEGAVREHARLVYRIAYSVLRNRNEAEDAVQEVFLRALRHGKKLADVVDRKAWLAQVAWRVAVKQRRRAAGYASQIAADDTTSLPSPEIGAEGTLLEKERREFLQRLIGGLPERLRDPLVLTALEELSPHEIAQMLGLSEAAVRTRAFRARQILRDRMAARMGVKK